LGKKGLLQLDADQAGESRKKGGRSEGVRTKRRMGKGKQNTQSSPKRRGPSGVPEKTHKKTERESGEGKAAKRKFLLNRWAKGR